MQLSLRVRISCRELVGVLECVESSAIEFERREVLRAAIDLLIVTGSVFLFLIDSRRSFNEREHPIDFISNPGILHRVLLAEQRCRCD